MAISAAQMITYTDKLVACGAAVVGNPTADCGVGTYGGTFGASKRAEELESSLMTSEDYDIVGILGAPFRALRVAVDANVLLLYLGKGSMQALNLAAAAAGIALGETSVYDLDTFATYYNLTATPKWSCLYAPNFREAMSSGLGLSPTATSFYYELLQNSGSHPNGLAKYVVGTGFSTGDSVDSTKYAGGYGQLKLSGITSTAPGLVTVSGTFRKTDGTTATGDATATISSSSTSPASLTPPFTDALLLAVSNVTVHSNITGGTIYVEAAKPSGRP